MIYKDENISLFKFNNIDNFNNEDDNLRNC